MTTQFKTWYMDQAVFNLAEVIDTAKERLADVDFDTLVGTGFSGGIVVPSLALAMGKKFVLIRKENDDSHHGRGRLLGELGARWVFVDDLISSGSTRQRVIEKVEEQAPFLETGTVMVGQYMYTEFKDYDSLERGKFKDYDSLERGKFTAYSSDWTDTRW